jgi:hypothetical protein
MAARAGPGSSLAWWWAHIAFTRIDIELTILSEEIEETLPV